MFISEITLSGCITNVIFKQVVLTQPLYLNQVLTYLVAIYGKQIKKKTFIYLESFKHYEFLVSHLDVLIFCNLQGQTLISCVHL